MWRYVFSIFIGNDRLNRSDKRKIEKIKAEPESAKTVKRYGIMSAIVLAVGLVAAFLEFLIIPYISWPIIKFAFSGIHFALLGNIFILGIGTMSFFLPIYIIAFARKLARMQLAINDQKIGFVVRILGWIGLGVAVVAMVASAWAILPYMISKVK